MREEAVPLGEKQSAAGIKVNKGSVIAMYATVALHIVLLSACFSLPSSQWLAVTNHNFYLTERRRHYLRYTGGLAFFETNGPSVYRTYCLAGERLGLDASAWGYWALHVKEDERHGRWMVEDAAIPLAHRCVEAAHERHVSMYNYADNVYIAVMFSQGLGSCEPATSQRPMGWSKQIKQDCH